MRHFIFHRCIRIHETMPRGKSFNHSIHLGLERAEKHDLLVKDTLVLVISTLHIYELLEEERNIFLSHLSNRCIVGLLAAQSVSQTSWQS